MFVSSVWPIFPAHGTQGLVKTACNIFLVKVIESEVNEDTELFSSSKLFSILKNSTKHKIFILLKTFLIFPSKLARERPRIGVCASQGGEKTVWSRQESRGTLCVGGGRGRPLSACRPILERGIGRLSLPALRKARWRWPAATSAQTRFPLPCVAELRVVALPDTRVLPKLYAVPRTLRRFR